MLLEAVGFQTRSTNDARETVKIVEDWQPTVVLLDLRMPQLSGFEVMDQIKRLKHCPIVIAITGDATPEVRSQCLESGFTDFLAKPFSQAKLAAVIRAHLEQTPQLPQQIDPSR